VNEDAVKRELVDAEEQDSLPTRAVSPFVAIRPKRKTRKPKRYESDSGQPAADSDALFGQFVAAELCAITDPTKKLYTKLLIHNIINTAMSEH